MSNEFSTVRIAALLQALSPITHNSGTEGNETIIQQEAVSTPDGIQHVPSLSGNAIRHRMIREPGGRYLVKAWGLEGELSIRALQFIFHGGALEQGCQTESSARLIDFWRIFPLYRLLGGSLVNAILPGSLNVWRGMLCCSENAERLRMIMGPTLELPDKPLLPARRFIGRYEYYTGSASKTERDLAKAGDEELRGLMPFSGQTIIAGSIFAIGFDAINCKEIEIAALLHSLREWQQNPTLGGQSARGHGRFALAVHTLGYDIADLCAKYEAHVAGIKEAGIAWIMQNISDAPAKSKKGTKAKAPLESTQEDGDG